MLRQDPKLIIKADFVLKGRLPTHRTVLFVGELHAADRSQEKIAKKIYRHLRGLSTTITNETFDYSVDEEFYVLNVFQLEKDLKAAQERSANRQKFHTTYQFFLLNTVENLKVGFNHGRVNFR